MCKLPPELALVIGERLTNAAMMGRAYDTGRADGAAQATREYQAAKPAEAPVSAELMIELETLRGFRSNVGASVRTLAALCGVGPLAESSAVMASLTTEDALPPAVAAYAPGEPVAIRSLRFHDRGRDFGPIDGESHKLGKRGLWKSLRSVFPRATHTERYTVFRSAGF